MWFLKRFALFLIGLVLILVLAFWGFKHNFPGKSIANAVQVRLSTQTGIPFEIEAFELGWLKVSTPEIALRTPKWLVRTPDIRLLILENVEAPFTPIFISGKAKILGQLHGGTIEASTDLLTWETMDISLDGVQLERVPLIAAFPYAFISGSLSLSSEIDNIKAIQQQQSRFPEGNLKGQLNDVQIRISGGAALFNLQFPELVFSEVMFEINFLKNFFLKGVILSFLSRRIILYLDTGISSILKTFSIHFLYLILNKNLYFFKFEHSYIRNFFP